MTIGASTAASKQDSAGPRDAVADARAAPPPRMPLTRRLLSLFALGLALSSLAAAVFGIAGSDDGLFVSLLCAGGFLSLTATAALRYFSNGRF